MHHAMTETLRAAAAATSTILDRVDNARALLHCEPRCNAAGILGDPAACLAQLKAAHALIADAIKEHGAVSWPNEADYHAL